MTERALSLPLGRLRAAHAEAPPGEVDRDVLLVHAGHVELEREGVVGLAQLAARGEVAHAHRGRPHLVHQVLHPARPRSELSPGELVSPRLDLAPLGGLGPAAGAHRSSSSSRRTASAAPLPVHVGHGPEKQGRWSLPAVGTPRDRGLMGDLAVQGRAERRPIEHVPSVPPLVGDYEARRRTFSWEGARAWLEGDAEGHLNMAHEAVDRHAEGELADAVAIRFLARTTPTTELTYTQLRQQSDVAATALRQLGVGPGDGVCTLLPRSPELYLTVLGTLKAGAVYCPLFPAFGPEPVMERLRLGHIRVLVTDTPSYLRKVEPHRDSLPDLRHVLLTDAEAAEGGDGADGAGGPPGTMPWSVALGAGAAAYDPDTFA